MTRRLTTATIAVAGPDIPEDRLRLLDAALAAAVNNAAAVVAAAHPDLYVTVNNPEAR